MSRNIDPERSRAYYRNNREQALETRKRYRDANRDRIRQRQRDHDKKMRDTIAPLRDAIINRLEAAGVTCCVDCQCNPARQLLCELSDAEVGILHPGDPGYKPHRVADYGAALNEILGLDLKTIREYDPFGDDSDYHPSEEQLRRAAKSGIVNLLTEEKRCSECEQWKPLTDFAKDSVGLLGRRSQCRACTTIKRKEWEARRTANL